MGRSTSSRRSSRTVTRSSMGEIPTTSTTSGGPRPVVQRLDPIFKTLAPGRGAIPRTPGRDKVGGTAEDGYLHCGDSGAGHFVKMVHNGVEYGLMAAYAEGFNILRHADVGRQGRTIDAE